MTNMTVREFIDAFVSGYQKTEVVRFLYEDTDAQVFYNGDPIQNEMPEEVGNMTVTSVMAKGNMLYICAK